MEGTLRSSGLSVSLFKPLIVPSRATSRGSMRVFRPRARPASAHSTNAEEGGSDVWKKEILARSRDIVASRHPELLDLVQSQVLLVVERSATYVERREDGYLEPELVFLVGTAHFSEQSATDVERVVRTLRPENVVVELCRSRAGIMYADEAPAGSAASTSVAQGAAGKGANPFQMSGNGFASTVLRSLRLGGNSALALQLLLASVSERMTASTGVVSGAEFRAARRASEAVGAQLVLGDRPIEITLQRAWAALSWRERVRLFADVAGSLRSEQLSGGLEGAALEALKTDDAVSALFAQLRARFPSLVGPLVEERDRYLAWTLRRSKAVNGSTCVVGVMGKGHMDGVLQTLKVDSMGLRFKDLAQGQNEPDMKTKLIRRVAIELLIGGILWFAWESAVGGKPLGWNF